MFFIIEDALHPLHLYQIPQLTNLIRFIIITIFDFLRNLMFYFDNLYIKLCTSINYKKLIL